MTIRPKSARPNTHPMPVIEAVISDLDGVVYRGATPIDSAVAVFKAWAAAGIPYCFVTNNSTRTPEEVAEKLNAMGVAAEPRQVVTSAIVAAGILQRRWPSGGRAYVIGAPALASAMEAAGFTLCEEMADCVVVGLDRRFDYDKLDRAARLVREGAAFIATNPDAMLPTADGFEPGNGALVAAIATASGSSPMIVGKPEPHLVDEAVSRLGVPRTRAIMIGDQIATDIASAQAAGVFSVLVQTGVPQRETAIVPDLVVESLAQIDCFASIP